MDELQKYRQLIGGSKIGEATIGPDLAKVRPSVKIKKLHRNGRNELPQHIEDDFVRERANSKDESMKTGRMFTTQDLIQRMFVARYG
jgi:hypothetical protein